MKKGKHLKYLPKILVAEDDEVNFILLEEILSRFPYKVVRAITGLEAVKFCKEDPEIRLVLMDIKMPRMNGLEATKLIRQFNTELPIVAQTAYAMSGDKIEAIDAGCNDYLPKPLNINDIKDILIKYLGKYDV